MKHHLDHASASDLSDRVLQERRRRAELGLEPMYTGAERRQLPRAVFTAYIADRESVPDSYQGELSHHGPVISFGKR